VRTAWWQQDVKPDGQAMNALRAPVPPAPLSELAYYGIAGEFVKLVRPQTEADPAAVLIQFLVAVGAYLGRDSGYYYIEATRHVSNLFAVIVGKTAKGRKGTGWNRVKQPLYLLDEGFTRNNIVSGLASGEGLIHRVRDQVFGWDPKKTRNSFPILA
jgi:hypothetical protein